MSQPRGSLTAAQHELMEIVWGRGAAGASATEVWQAVSDDRSVGRTTVLNLLRRLEQRGWLVRQPGQGADRYVAAVGREQTASQMAESFVKDFFGGSASELVMSLLGSRQLPPDEIAELRRLLEEKPQAPERQEDES